MIRQGDVFLVPFDEKVEWLVPVSKKINKDKPIPADNGRVVLAYGEVTGHAHALHSNMIRHYRDTEGSGLTVTQLVVDKPTMLRHEEHPALPVNKGKYHVVRQREYSPEAIRNVAD